MIVPASVSIFIRTISGRSVGTGGSNRLANAKESAASRLPAPAWFPPGAGPLQPARASKAKPRKDRIMPCALEQPAPPPPSPPPYGPPGGERWSAEGDRL